MLPPQLSTSKISPMTSQQIAAIAARNTEKARRIIRDTGIIDIWESAGAEINLVGSLSTGLFMKHRDIDFHIYSAVLRPEDDFTALAKLPPILPSNESNTATCWRRKSGASNGTLGTKTRKANSGSWI